MGEPLNFQMTALRESAAWSEAAHVHGVRIGGVDAFEVLDRLCPAELYLQDTQVLATLLLDDNGRPVADLLVGRDDRDFILLAEGLDRGGLEEQLAASRGRFDVRLEDLKEGRTLFSVDGPYAWEVVAELVGPDVIGLPYLSFLTAGSTICFRVGKTGEFGYLLLVDDADALRVRERLFSLTSEFDLVEVSLEALDLCALENWFFNIRKEGRYDVTPLELQLQWRVSYRKSYRGSGALDKHRQRGPSRRLTTVVADGELGVGDPVLLNGAEVGEVANAGYSFARDEHVGLVFLDVALAMPGIDLFEVQRRDERVRVRTVSPPLLNNRSLYVSPQLHSYATRDAEEFPPLHPEHARR